MKKLSFEWMTIYSMIQLINDQLDSKFFREKKTLMSMIVIRKFNRIERHLEPIINNDHLLESLQSIYDQYSSKIDSNHGNRTNTYSSKIARRLLVLVFVEQCQEKIKQIEGLTKLLPLSFRSNQVKH